MVPRWWLMDRVRQQLTWVTRQQGVWDRPTNYPQMINVFDGNAVHSPVTSNYCFQIEGWIWQQVTWVTREQRHQQVEDRGANCREMTTGLFATDSLSSLMSDYLHHLSRPRCPIQWILCGWGHPQSTTLPLNLNTESADLVLCFNISEAEKKEKHIICSFPQVTKMENI